jgi:hypothetical protein
MTKEKKNFFKEFYEFFNAFSPNAIARSNNIMTYVILCHSMFL